MSAEQLPDDRPDDERAEAEPTEPTDQSDDEATDEVPVVDGPGAPVARPTETSDAEVDAVFAAMMAGYGRTAGPSDRVHPTHADPAGPDRAQKDPPARRDDSRSADPGLIEPAPEGSSPSGPRSLSWPTRGFDDWADAHPLLARRDSPGSDPARPDPTRSDPTAPDAAAPHRSRADPPPTDARSTDATAAGSGWRASPRLDPSDDESFERYRPELHPIGRPRWPIVVGWSGMLFAVVATLLAIFGVPVPGWIGWLSVAGFLGGFGLLVAQLPRHRPPDAGDGAVL